KFWQKMVSEADIFLLVVDSRKGPTPQDHHILNYLRRYRRPVILVINKVDNPKLAEEKLRQFSELVADEVVWVSALLKKNLASLRELIASYLPQTSLPSLPSLKIAIVGRPNVGKSTLLNALIKKERALIDAESGTTRDELEAPLTSDIVLIDTPGLKRRSRIRTILEFFSSRRALYQLKKADLILLVIDASEGIVHQELKIASLAKKAEIPVIVVLNKIDLVDKEKLKLVEENVRNRLYFLGEVQIIKTSALHQKGLQKVREAIMKFSEAQKLSST
ncbi:GTP-binding protein, partial [bacterium]|nr:GTP-binding protein [bacterium]